MERGEDTAIWDISCVEESAPACPGKRRALWKTFLRWRADPDASMHCERFRKRRRIALLHAEMGTAGRNGSNRKGRIAGLRGFVLLQPMDRCVDAGAGESSSVQSRWLAEN